MRRAPNNKNRQGLVTFIGVIIVLLIIQVFVIGALLVRRTDNPNGPQIIGLPSDTPTIR